MAANTIVVAAAMRNFVMMIVRRGTGVASRCTIDPSSISAPRTLVPMISAVSGRTTEKPKSPRIRAGQAGSGGLLNRSTVATPMRMSGGTANSRARLRPSAARSVITATVLFQTAMVVPGFLSVRARAPAAVPVMTSPGR